MAKDTVYLYGVKFSEAELWLLCKAHKYFFVKYNTVYQLHWSNAQGTFYATEVYRNIRPKNLLKRGQHGFFDGKQVNALIGAEIFLEE